eukprot:g19841.t1
MCTNIREDLGSTSCEDLLDGNGKGFRLVGTMASPLSYNGASFNIDIDGFTSGSRNVCMLAAFGNGGVATAFDGDLGPIYFGPLADLCGYNDLPFDPGHTIDWSYPLGTSCVGDSTMDLGLTSIDCYAAKDPRILQCRDGRWQVRGECFLEGVNVTEASAAQILLRLSLDLEGMNASDGFAWAEQHLDHLYRAFGKTIDVHPAELRLQLLPSSLGRRLGQTTLAFDVRLTLLLEANVSTLSLQEAMQDLAYLADVTGISHFEDALQKELESAGSASTVTRVILGTLGSAEAACLKSLRRVS